MQEIYTQILELGRVSGAGSKFIRMSELYASGAWERTSAKLSFFTRPLSGGTVLDYGSKFGHLTPVLKSLGAARVINVDVDEEYLRDGERFIGQLTGATFVRSEDCYLNLESDSVDFVLMKEVISHINPAFLFTCFQEVARVMKPGAELVISDGNNLDLAEVKDGLMESWCQWEHGTSKDLGSNYQAMRARMIAKAFPNLPEDRVNYFARNTSGLHTGRLLETVRRAVEDGSFIERPHRKGQLPVHPGYGTVMERGFHSVDVIARLAEHGLRAEQVDNPEGPAFVVRAYRTA
jgi:SAM-dependent methyltransferase